MSHGKPDRWPDGTPRHAIPLGSGGSQFDGAPVGADGHANTRADGWRNPQGMGWLHGQLPPADFRGASEYTRIGPGSRAFANNPAKFTTGSQRSGRRK